MLNVNILTCVNYRKRSYAKTMELTNIVCCIKTDHKVQKSFLKTNLKPPIVFVTILNILMYVIWRPSTIPCNLLHKLFQMKNTNNKFLFDLHSWSLTACKLLMQWYWIKNITEKWILLLYIVKITYYWRKF